MLLFRFGQYRRTRQSLANLPGVFVAFDTQNSIATGIPNNGLVATLTDRSTRASNPFQSGADQSPMLDLVACPGKRALRFDAGRYMEIFEQPSGRVRTAMFTFLVPVSASARPILAGKSVDDSMATTKPAWELFAA